MKSPALRRRGFFFALKAGVAGNVCFDVPAVGVVEDAGGALVEQSETCVPSVAGTRGILPP